MYHYVCTWHPICIIVCTWHHTCICIIMCVPDIICVPDIMCVIDILYKLLCVYLTLLSLMIMQKVGLPDNFQHLDKNARSFCKIITQLPNHQTSYVFFIMKFKKQTNNVCFISSNLVSKCNYLVLNDILWCKIQYKYIFLFIWLVIVLTKKYFIESTRYGPPCCW